MDVRVLDSGINLSDHCPLAIMVRASGVTTSCTQQPNSKRNKEQLSFRWDHCDVTQYSLMTRDYLNCITVPTFLLFGDNHPFLDSTDIRSYINIYYDSIVSALQQSSCVTVPVKKERFL